MSVETVEFLGMVRRMLRAASRRVAEADEFELAELVSLREDLEEAIATAISGQRESGGRSWASIAEALGISKQGAQQRYGRKPSTERPITQ